MHPLLLKSELFNDWNHLPWGRGRVFPPTSPHSWESGNWWDEMALFVEEPLRWQVPPLALCQLHPADLQGCGFFEEMNKTCTIFSFMWWDSQFDPSEVACCCLKCSLYRSREVMRRVVFVCILIFGLNLGNMLTGASPMKTGESTFNRIVHLIYRWLSLGCSRDRFPSQFYWHPLQTKQSCPCHLFLSR